MFHAVTQDAFLDSLSAATVEMEDDTLKVMNLLALSRSFSRIDLDRSRKFCDLADQLARRLDYGKGIAGAWFERSIITMRTGNIDTALIYNERSLRINDSLRIYDQLAHNYNLKGSLLLMKNDSYQAMDSFKKSLSLFKRTGDSANIVYAYNSLGMLHESQGNFDSSVYYYIQYVKLSEAAGREELVGIGLVNLSNLSLKLEDYQKAKAYAMRSIELNRLHNRNDLVVFAYKNLGIVHAKEKEYDESIRYFKLGTDLAREIELNFELASIYINMGNMYEERMLFDSAMENYEKAKEIGMALDNTSLITSSMINIGLIHQRRKDYGMALSIYDSCLFLLEGSGNYYELSTVYHNMYKVYELMGDNKKALYFLSSYHAMHDSAVNLESTKAIAELTLKYEREKDQARILAYQNEGLKKDVALEKRTRQRNSYMLGGAGTIVLFIFVFATYWQRIKRQRMMTEHKIQQLEEEKKLLAARSIVEGQEEERKRIAKELHDGLGVLLSSAKMHFTSIRDQSPEARPMIDKATKLLEQASGDVRKISHNMMPGLLTKLGLYEAVEDLFEQVSEMEGINARVMIEGEQARLNENTEIMLYRIIQEMVNNALKHAEAGNIRLDMEIFPDKININFSDDGKGFILTDMEKSKSMGLKSIESRTNFMNGMVSLVSSPGKGTQYSISVPLDS